MISVDRADLAFQLFDALPTASLGALPRFSDYDRTAMNEVLDTAERIAMEHFLPHAAALDLNEPRFENGKVVMDPQVGAALAVYREAGFFGAGFDREWGGAQMPETLRGAVNFIFSMANTSTAAYPLLTAGAAHLIASFGSDEQKDRFMKPMIEGRFFGTMCLSEPQAGSSLAELTTRAEPRADGSYGLTGNKMWISGGDHEMSENIIHMVLAKIPDSPAGVKGISLFIVPKILVGVGGALGARNGVALAGLNRKMGYRGTTNAALNLGENTPCIGYLVGEPDKGLSYMFQMMNEARISVGLGATALGAAGYRASLLYAKERPQGHLPGNWNPDSSPVPIIEHADVKRMLLAQKAAAEGALALLLYAAFLVDAIKAAPSAEASHDSRLLLDLLTPIAKSWPSEFCLEANKHAIQVLGGYGYTLDYPVERLYRDNRANSIHEGTHGIQAIDLLGRKVMQENGAGMKVLAARVMADVTQAHTHPELAGHAEELAAHLGEAVATTGKLAGMVGIDPRLGLANASLYLDMMGHVVIAWMWLRQATAALRKRGGEDANADFIDGKLATCRYFFLYELPKARTQRALLDNLDDTTLTMKPEWF
ncbi:alkylation response protein AidB-like acyl-CoA dehydrogenase [Mesorhizobium soli]|uniref:acyl-CoA dehydrogenase n=1 Tax=Pseudaminobacter soli (ex Li et al. 2025) TaxID=1295366 RepID=UPI002476B212|nr:acyl-CoA dehydrogenase [Mesorhizobium soli]MDH6231163.1 alkylation response protein AidB-like acyl-CoA dehydrogenase [Mesorhizobium soli]